MLQLDWLSAVELEIQLSVDFSGNIFQVLDSVEFRLLWMCVCVRVCEYCEFWIYILPVRIIAPTRVLAGTNIKETDSWRARPGFRFTGREGREEKRLSLKPCLNVDYGSLSCWEHHAVTDSVFSSLSGEKHASPKVNFSGILWMFNFLKRARGPVII